MRRLRTAAAALMFCLCLSACGAETASVQAPATEEYGKYTAYFYDAFDTNISLTGYCRSSEEFEDYSSYAEGRFNELHRIFDIYFTYPGLNNAKTINDNAGKAPVKAAPELYELVSFGRDMYALTGGKVNIAMGAVLKQWHNAREFGRAFPELAMLPDYGKLAEASEHCRMEDVVQDGAERTIFLRDPEMSLDLGAAAKGFAVEKIAGELRELGWKDFAINAGGNVRVGSRADGSGWRVAVKDPVNEGKYIAAVTAENTSVVTSGVGERCFFYEGRRYHHIIDGETLMPEERYLSVSVMYPDSAAADALSTALFNMELEEGRALAEALEGAEVLWVLPDGSLEYTRGFEAADIIN